MCFMKTWRTELEGSKCKERLEEGNGVGEDSVIRGFTALAENPGFFPNIM